MRPYRCHRLALTLPALTWLVLAGSSPAAPSPTAAATKPVVLLSLEWPPHTSAQLPEGGRISQQVNAAYARLGTAVEIGFFPWPRSLRLPYTDHRFAGMFPVYPTRERRKVCHLSAPIGQSDVRLAQRQPQPVRWQALADLASYRLGIVRAYANEDRFDDWVQSGRLKTRVAETDRENLLNLAQQKVDAAVIDTEVFAWLMTHEPSLRPYQGKLVLQEKSLASWPLYVCFRRDAEGAVQRDQFNRGLNAESGKAEPALNAKTPSLPAP